MKIYTKTGDDGTTGLYGGGRVSKASLRVDAYGSLDEVASCLGLVQTAKPSASTATLLTAIQNDLFVLGAELACVPGKEDKLGMRLVDAADIERLEKAIDLAETELPPLKNFVLAGGCPAAAHVHHARTVCRRAERGVLALAGEKPEDKVRSEIVIYLNRLSDLLFVLARLENKRAGAEEIPWIPR